MRVKVIGLKRFVGNVDGQNIKSGKLFCEVRLNDERNSKDQFAKGYAVEELRVSPELVERLEHITLPFVAEAETERVSNGKTATERVIDVRPIDTVTGVIAPAIKKAA